MSDTADTLEQSYRRYTRLLPPEYRAAREDEMVSVLLQGAEPTQTKASTAEAADLLITAAKLWLPYAIGPDRASRRAAAAVLAVLLPSVFLYGAGMSTRVISSLPASAVPGYLRYDRYAVAWLAWTVVAVLLLLHARRTARVAAILATLLYLLIMSYSLWQFGPNPFAPAVSWLLVQVVAVALLLRRGPVQRGFAIVPRWWQAVIGLSAFALGFTHYWWWAVGQGAAARLVVAIVGICGGALLMRTRAGRVIVPVLGGLVAFAVATRIWANNIRWYNHSGVDWIQLTDVLFLVTVPLLTIVVLRLFASLLDRVTLDLTGARAADPETL